MIRLYSAFILFVTSMAALGNDDCRKLYRLTDLNYAIEPGISLQASETIPAHCSVTGVINRAIRFTVRMPNRWNGKMMFSGVGGLAGVIGDTTSLLDQGFAMASTDTGHEMQEALAFIQKPEALIDYAFRGVHLATVAAKKVISTYYGKTIDYSYFKGCSNGGRAAMLEAARFPNDYDGIIAGAPAFHLVERLYWFQHVFRAQESNPLTHKSLAILDNASRESCDTLDGVEDGVINDPRLCTETHFSIDSLLCVGTQTDECLTEGQLETARAIYEDLKDSQGNVISPGVPPGAEAGTTKHLGWASWLLPIESPVVLAATGLDEGKSLISSNFEMLELLMRFDATFDIETWKQTDRQRIGRVTAPLDLLTPDLTEFRDNGGKLLIYQGWHDFAMRPGRIIEYLSQVEAASGGSEATGDFFRLFMVPGMLHCRGGPGAWQADYVAPLVEWREHDLQPSRILATKPDTTGRSAGGGLWARVGTRTPENNHQRDRLFTRPLCVYPKLAEYVGDGDNSDWRNFVCR